MNPPRQPLSDEIADAVFDALSDEEWHHMERRFTFGGYGLMGFACCAISIWQAASDPIWFWSEWYRPTLVSVGFLMFISCVALYVNTKLEMKRLRGKLKKLRPEVYL